MQHIQQAAFSDDRSVSYQSPGSALMAERTRSVISSVVGYFARWVPEQRKLAGTLRQGAKDSGFCRESRTIRVICITLSIPAFV